MKLNVLYEDNHLLVVVKPAGLPTQGVSADRPSLIKVAKNYIKQKYKKPGNVYLGVVSRLDTPVSGVVVLARTSKAARRLNEQFRGRVVGKRYWALVEGMPDPEQGQCVDWIHPDERHQRMRTSAAPRPKAVEARLNYRCLRVLTGISLLEIELLTGRKHQIRAQLADRGWPIVGDRKYGSSRSFPAGIALHARRLDLAHPVSGAALQFVAPPPESWGASLK